MVEAFSLLAVGTSLIGTLLGFSEFYKEQLNTMISVSPETIEVNKLFEKNLIRKDIYIYIYIVLTVVIISRRGQNQSMV